MKVSILFSLMVALCLVVAGCAGVKDSMRPSEKISQWNPIDKIKRSKKDDAVPETMAVIWSDTVLEKPGTAPVRGFGGRIFFYDKDNQAVKADGELIVYGFDNDSPSREGGPKADRKFVFKQDNFQSHYSESKLGPSYSVWIPWEKVGGFRKSIALIPMFRSTDERVIKAAQSINVLPGKAAEQQTAQKSDISGIKRIGAVSKVAQAGYESANQASGNVAQAELIEERPTNLGRVRTTTIDLPPSLASKMLEPVNITPRTTRDFSKQAARTTKPKSADSKVVSASEGQSGEKTGGSNVDTSQKEKQESQSSRDRPVFGRPGAFR